jgi:tetratricopeptide (TPR) repeat protein/tRNA A-37 threonylcarbamoyl transferase component Bud32
MNPKPEESQGMTLVLDDRAAPGPDRHPTALASRNFAAGDVVAGRYQVVRFLSAGAMGEVYEVEDLSLHERVALKTIRPEVAGSPESLARFKRELRMARRVTHPNVCRVFDLGEHRFVEDEPETGLTFLTMELLEGETLYEYLARNGRLPPGEVLRLAEQMAAALDAAHSAQVIHRDFKSNNVMRVRSPQGEVRAVVTDFGLALAEVPTGDAQITRERQLLGSPGYMSPEQVAGEPLSPASDIYSFGVVLFELVTGRLPFVAPTPAATALMRLREPPPSPRELVPELEPLWERVLLRCLARLPHQRFATASEVIATLRGPSGVSSSSGGLAAPFPKARSGSLPVLRRGMAVLAPRNLSGRAESAWLSTALAEMLCAELALGGQLRLLSGESVARMRKDLSLPEEEGFAEDTLWRIRAWAGVDQVLTGSFVAVGRGEAVMLRLSLRVQEVSTAETVAHVTVTGAERDLLELVTQAGASLRERLGMGPLSSEQVHGVRGALPATAEAARLYAEGLAALRGLDAATAVERLERTLDWEPTFAPAWSALAAAFRQLYLESRAKEAARRAFELSVSLSGEERMVVRARHHEAQAEWTQAIEAWRTLLGRFPDNVEYGAALAAAQVAAGRTREAQETLTALRRLPAPLSEDVRLDLAAVEAMSATSDFLTARRLAQEAVRRARQVGQSQLTATALVHEAYAARNLGEAARAVELLEEAERLFQTGGDRGGAARALMIRAFALKDVGQLRSAEASILTAVRVARELQGASLVAEGLTNAGILSCQLGELDEALRRALEARELYQKLEMPVGANHATLLLGMVRGYRGELDEGQRLLEQAGQAARERFGDDYVEAWARYELGLLLLARGALEQARPQLEQALALRRARGIRAFVAESELALARQSLEEGRLEESLALAEQALAAHAALRSPDKEGLAHAVRARVLLAQGELPRARRALASARMLAGSSEELLILAEVALTEARMALGHGTPEEHQAQARRLQQLVARAARAGLQGVWLEARLVLAELSQANAEFSAIEREATRLGYLPLARMAITAARR